MTFDAPDATALGDFLLHGNSQASYAYAGDLQAFGQKISGTLTLTEPVANQTPSSLSISASDLSLSFGDGTNPILTASGGTISAFTIGGNDGGSPVDASVSFSSLSFTLSSVLSINGSFGLQISNSTSPAYVRVTAGGTSPDTTADFSILNNDLKGNFTFEQKTTADSKQVVTVATSDLNVDFGTFVGVHDASAAFAIDGSGIAGTATGMLQLVIPNVTTPNTTFTLDVNTTGSPVMESVNVAGADQTIDVDAGPSVKIELSGELDIGPAGSAQSLSGTFDFEDSQGDVTVGFSGVTTTLGGVVTVNNASGILNVTADGISGSVDIDSVQLPQSSNASISAGVKLAFTTHHDGPTDITVTGNNVSLTVFGQSLTGNFTFARSAAGASIDFDTVGLKFGGGVVDLEGAKGHFDLTSAGVKGTATVDSITTTVPDFTFGAGFSISVDTTSADKHVEFAGSGLDVTIAGQMLHGNFTVEERTSGNDTIVTMGATDVSVSLAGGVASITGGSGGFILSNAGFAGSAGGTLHLAATGIVVQGDFRLDVNETTDPVKEDIDTSNGTVTLDMPAGKFVRFEGTGVSFDFGNVFVGGNFTVQSTQENNQTVVTVGVAGGTAFLGSGRDTPDETGAKITGVTGGILITDAGVALDVSGEAALVGAGDVTLHGTLHALVNTTSDPVTNVLIHVPDVDNGPGTDITLNLDPNEQSISGQTLTVSIASFVDLQADVVFTKTTTPDGSGGTITEVDAAADHVSAFFGTGDGTPGATGFKLDNGQFGLILIKTQPASGPAPASKYALVASGDPSIVGGDPVTLSGSIEVKLNRTGSDLKDNGEARTIQTPTGQVTFDFDNGNDITQIGGHLTFAFAGFVSLEGDYFFSKDVEPLAGGGQTITFQVSANNVKAFLGSTADPSKPVGVTVTAGSMALQLVRSIPSTGPPAPAQFALVASGHASLDGIDGLTLSGGVTIKYNNSGVDYSANPVTFNGVTIDIPTGLHEFDVTDLTLSISSFVDLKGSFSFSKTVQDDGTTEIDVSASGVSAFLGTGNGTDNATGVQLDSGEFGLIIYKSATASVPSTYALIASGDASLKGLENVLSLSGSLNVRINKTGKQVTQTLPTSDGKGIKFDFTTTDNVEELSGGLTLSIPGFVDLTGTFGFRKTDTEVSATETKTEIDVAATGVTATLGVGSGDNEVGIKISQGTFGLVLYKTVDTSLATQAAPTYALTASGAVSLMGLPGLNTDGSTFSVKVNTTGGKVTATASAPDPNDPTQTIDVPITFAANDPPQSFSGHLTIQILLSDGNPLASLEGDISASKDAGGLVELSVQNLKLKAYANGSQLFTLGGSVTFSIGPSTYSDATKQGFKLVSWSAGDISFGGTSLNATAGKTLRSLAATPDTTKSLGPLRFADVTPTLNDFSFSGGNLSFNLGLSATLAGLSFGGSNTGDSTGTNSGGVTAQFKHLSGSFGLSVSVDPTSFRVTSVSGTGKFSLTAQEFDFSVSNAVSGVFNGISVNYDPKLDSTQTIVSIDSGSLTIPSLSNLTFSINKVGNTPGLVVTGQSFHFASATVSVTKTFSIGALTITNPSVTLTNFGVDYSQGTVDFGNSALTVKASLSLNLASASVSGTGLSITLTFGQDGSPSGFSFHADSITASFGTYVTASANNVTITPTATGTDPVLIVKNSVTAELKVGALDVSGSASGFEVLADGSFAQLPDQPFTVTISITSSADAGDSGDLGWPSWIPIQLNDLSLSWPDLAGDPGNIDITISASVSGSLGPLSLSGSVTDLTINTKLLTEGQFPITSLGNVTASATGSLFGGAGQVSLAATFGIVRADAAGVLIPTSDKTTQADMTAMYVGLDGGFQLENLSLRIQFAMSAIKNTDGSFSVFPLGVYFSFDSAEPLILDPDTGLALLGLRGGVQFNAPPLPQIDNPFDLMSPAFSPPAQLTGDQWSAQLQQQVINQLGGGGFIFRIPKDQGGKIASLDSTILDLFSQNGYGLTTPTITTVDSGNTWIITDAHGRQYLVDNGGSVANDYLVSSLITSLPFDQATADALAGNSVPQSITDALTAANIVLPAGSTAKVLTDGSRWLVQNGTSKYVVAKRGSTFVITGGGGGTANSLGGPIKIFAGATFTDAYAPDAVNGSVDLIIETDGAIVINGALTFGGGQLTANARVFIDLRGLNGQNPQQGQPDPIRVVFLAQMPQAGTSAIPPVFSLYGTLTVSFFKNGQEIPPSQADQADMIDLKLDHAGATLNAFNQQQVILGASLAANPTGAGLLELQLSSGTVHLKVDANVAVQGQLLSGNVAHGSGDLTLQVTNINNALRFDVWGALRIDINLDNIQKLHDLGVTVNGTFFLRLNTTAIAKSVTLNVLNDNGQVDPVDTSLPAQSVELFVAGHVSFDRGPAHLDMGGVFDIAYSTATGFSLFLAVELKMDLGGTTIFEFQALGLLVVHNDGGLALHLELDRSANVTSGDLQFSGNVGLTLDVNTTQAQVDYELPPDLTSIISADLPADLLARLKQNQDQDGNYHVIISAGPPLFAGGFGQPAVYLVARGTADLNLENQFTVSGTIYIAVTSSGFDLTVGASVTVSALGTLNVDGTLHIDSSGVVAALDLSIPQSNTFGSGSGLKITGEFSLVLNTTSSPHDIDVPGPNNTTITLHNIPAHSVRVHIEGSIDVLSFAQASASVDIAYQNNSLTIDGMLTFTIGPLSTSGHVDMLITGGGVVANAGATLTGDVGGGVFHIDASGTLLINTTGTDQAAPNTTTVIPHGSFSLSLNGSLSVLGVVKVDPVSLDVQVGGGTFSHTFSSNPDLSSPFNRNGITAPSTYTQSVGEGQWAIGFGANMSFFGIATLTADGWVNSDGHFDIRLYGGVTIGTHDFGLFGTMYFRVFLDSNQFGLQLSADVGARLFGITLADVGLDADFTATRGSTIDVSLDVTVHLTIVFIHVSKTAHFDLGVLQIPPEPQLAGVDNNGQLTVFVGPNASQRNVGTGITDETVYLERVAGDPGTTVPGAETIRVIGFGYSKDYANVTSIFADGGGGNDAIIVRPNSTGDLVDVPAQLNGGSGNDTLIYDGGYAGSTTVSLDGGLGADYLEIGGAVAAPVLLEGGEQVTDSNDPSQDDDTLVDNGTGAGTLNGGPGDDELTGGPGNDTLHGGAGNDVLQANGGTDHVYGDADDDVIKWTVGDGADTVVDGGTGTNYLVASGTTGTDDLRVTSPASNQVKVADYSAGNLVDSVTATNVQNISVDARAGSDSVSVADLTGSGAQTVTVDLGQNLTTDPNNPTKTIPDPIDPTQTDVVPNLIVSPDGAADSLTVLGSANDDNFNVSETNPDASHHLQDVRVDWQGHYSVEVQHAVRSEGDALTVDAGEGNNTIDASGVGVASGSLISQDLIALTLKSGGGIDRLIGSPYNDVLNGGLGNDTYTGGLGLDTFIDAGGENTLIEQQNADFGLFGNKFVVGTIVADDGHSAFFKSDPTSEQTRQQQLEDPNNPGHLAYEQLPAPVAFPITSTGDHYLLGAVVEDITGIFAHVVLTGGDGNNTMVVGDLDGTIYVGTQTIHVTPFTGTVTLDNQRNTANQLNEYYILNVTGAAGATYTIDDSGGTSGFDELVVNGTNAADQFHLNGDNTSGQGAITAGDEGASSHDTINFTGADRLWLNTLDGNDSVLVDNTVVPTLINLGAGADDITVGTVPLIADPTHPTLEYPDGIPVADTSRMTNGNSTVLTVYGGANDDNFEVNHNTAKLYLSGDDGNDRFVINTFVVQTDPGNPAVPANLATLFGGTGNNSYQYLQNAPVLINGGPGIDTIVVVGTPIDDTFVVTDTYIAGAGRITNFTNIESIEIDGGGGNDQIYILSTSSAFETTVNGGSGDDTIHLGGDPPPLLFTPPPYTYSPPSYTVQGPPKVVYQNYALDRSSYTFDISLAQFVGSYGSNADTAVRDVLNQLEASLAATNPYFKFDGFSYASANWRLLYNFFYFFFDPQIEITVSNLAFNYEIGHLEQTTQTIHPAAVTITPPPMAFKAPANFDLSKIQGRLTIEGGNAFETSGDTVIVHDEQGPSGVGQLVTRTAPVMQEIGEDANGNPIFRQETDNGVPVTRTFQSLEGIGIPTGVAIDTVPYYGIEFQDLEHMQLLLGPGNDTFTVQSTPAGMDLTLDSGSGNDTVNLQSIGGSAIIHGGSGSDTVNIGNNGSLTGIHGLITVDGDTQTTETDAPIVWDPSTRTSNDPALTDLPAIVASAPLVYINTQAGVQQTAPMLYLATLSDGTQVLHGYVVVLDSFGRVIEDMVQKRDSGGNLLWLDNAGNVTTTSTGRPFDIPVPRTQDVVITFAMIHSGAVNDGYDVVNVDGSNDTFDAVGNLTSTRLTGIGLSGNDPTQGVTYLDLERLNVQLGTGNDTFTVQSTHAGQTHLSTGPGNDTVNVQTIAGPTFVDGQGDNDTINVGSIAPLVGGNVNSINALLTISGSAGTDTLNVDDTQDNFANVGDLTSTHLAGLGMAAGIDYDTLEFLNINLGSGSDVFTIESTHAATTNLNTNDGNDVVNVRTVAGPTNVDTGSGYDTVNVGTNAGTVDPMLAGVGAQGTLDGINGLLTLTADTNAGGNDVLNLDDTGETASATGRLTDTRLTGLGMSANDPAQGITYGGFEIIELRLGSGADNLTVDSVAPQAITAVYGDAGNDTFVVNAPASAGSALVVYGDTAADGTMRGLPGNDSIDAHSATLPLVLYGGAGDDTILGGQSNDLVAGGSGNDTLNGEPGNDILLGDSGFAVNLVTRLISVFTTGTPGLDNFDAPGNDTIEAGLGNDVAIGDQGIITQFGGVPNLLAEDGVTQTVESTNESLGGDDTLTAQGGRNVILGGAGADHITGGPGADVILGDNGIATFASDGTLLNIQTRNDLAGAGDSIATGGGGDVVFGGVGADTVNASTDTARDIVVGDQGQAVFSASGVLQSITTLSPSIGSADTILTGSGPDVILGGFGGDAINAGDGDNIIVGDNGQALFNAAGVLTSITTSDPAFGGDDQITTGSGRDVVLGGVGSDTINSGSGADVVLGDDGQAVFNDAGALISIQTSEPDTGGNDVIDAGTGANVVFGGAANDTIAATGDTSRNIIVGDNGQASFNAAGQVLTVQSTDFTSGGNDTITTGAGADLIVGGVGSDAVSAGADDDVVLGDNGILLFNLDGNPSTLDQAYTLASNVGGNDVISGGAGNDVILGGFGNDTVRGDGALDLSSGSPVAVASSEPSSDGNDIVLGDNGLLTYSGGTLVTVTTDSAALGVDPSLGGADVIFGDGANDTLVGGASGDEIHGGDGSDVIFGDNAQLNYTGGALTQAFTIDPTLGGSDTLTGDAGDDVIVGGTAGDTISAGDGNDLVLGDNGLYDRTNITNATFTVTYTASIYGGGDDVIGGDAGNDILIGSNGNDTIHGGDGNDLSFGDQATINGRIDLTQLPLASASKPFTFTSLDTTTDADNGNDAIYGDAGDDILIGGPGTDTIWGGDGNDDIIGGSNVAGAHDTGDKLDGGAGSDFITGDNASVLRTGTLLSVRDRALSGRAIFDAAGNPLVTAASQLDPNGISERSVVLFDQSGSHADPLTFGNDSIAGGAGDDLIFGQLGDDLIQGDSSISITPVITQTRLGPVVSTPSAEDLAGAGTDGNDYIEGNGGDDVIFGDLGQDDIIGGSSDLFSLTTPDQRPDGSDTLFGGAGTRISRNDLGDASAQGHARDADVILGDNGDIFRLVGINGTGSGAFLTYTYDNYGPLKIIPRAYKLLDYTQGANGTSTDIGSADLIQGEAGDDVILGGPGNDVLFGNGQDDNIIGGAGNDRIYGGSGDDGILGDDGLVLTSRNGLTEPLNGLTVANVQTSYSVPGPFIGAVEFITGQLLKTAQLIGPGVGGNDLIYGGLGNDFIHSGAGDDAISGAEAQAQWYDTLPVSSAFYSAGGFTVDPASGTLVDPNNPLGYNASNRKLGAYDANHPLAKIANFFLNFDATDASGNKIDDGKDRLFGDSGNDWMAGGTGHNRLFGGMGDDLLDADNNLDTAGGQNNMPDPAPYADADFVFGGGGLDVMIANTGADRLFDWSGEFNTYLVPFSPFGEPTVIRSPSPQIQKFLMNLGMASGADPSLTEPKGELGLVTQHDPEWSAQHGGPRDPQPGNTGGVGRDTQGGPENDAPAAANVATAASTGTSSLANRSVLPASRTRVLAPLVASASQLPTATDPQKPAASGLRTSARARIAQLH